MNRAPFRLLVVSGSALLLTGAAIAAPLAMPAWAERPAADLYPDSREGRCARAFVEMVNGKGDDLIRTFESEFRSDAQKKKVPIDQRIPRVEGVRNDFAPLTVTRVATTDEFVVFATTGKGDDIAMLFQMSPQQQGAVDGIEIMPAKEYQAPTRIDAAARTEIVNAVCATLEKEYVYPDVAKKMADHARQRLKDGAYQDALNERALAAALASDLRSVSHDKHLDVRTTREPMPTAEQQRATDDPQPDPDMAAMMARENYAFREVKRLEGNIGYLKFDNFVDSPEARQTAAAAMTFLSHSDALIVDLRENGGGDPHMIAFLTSFLFDSKTHLNDMVDRDGKVVEEYWTESDVPGRRLAADTPIYVLTSGFTFSGAEEFCYNLQNLHRATIVGETTGGGAHPVKVVGVRGTVALRVPFMRACNPISKKNWEGVGITPDIATPSSDALEKALGEARKSGRRRR